MVNNIGKSRFLELLENEPKYTDDGVVIDEEIREKWVKEIREAFYEDVLQKYEEHEYLDEEINELKEEVKELKKLLKTHVHSGEKVYAEIE